MSAIKSLRLNTYAIGNLPVVFDCMHSWSVKVKGISGSKVECVSREGREWTLGLDLVKVCVPDVAVNDVLELTFNYNPKFGLNIPQHIMRKNPYDTDIWWRKSDMKKYSWLPDKNPLVQITRPFFETCKVGDRNECLIAKKVRKFIPDAFVDNGNMGFSALGTRYRLSDLAYIHEKAFERSGGNWTRYVNMVPIMRFKLFPPEYYTA